MNDKSASDCTCPSGNGSLRPPCPAHPLFPAISHEQAIKLARAAAYSHCNEHSYLPQTWEVAATWQPHDWVISAIMVAADAAAPVVPIGSDAFDYLVDEVAAEHGDMLDDGGPSGWSFTCEGLAAFAKHLMSDYKGALMADAYAIARAEAKRDSPPAAPVRPSALTASIAELDEFLAGDCVEPLTLAQSEAAALILQELKRRMACTPAAPGIDLAALRDIASDLSQSAKVDDYEPQQIAFIESIRDRLRALIDASTKGGSDEASIPEPHQECYSDDGGDSWHEHPADAELVEGLAVGDTYTLTVSHYSVERTYRVTKAPDETSDDYEVEPMQATSAEVGS